MSDDSKDKQITATQEVLDLISRLQNRDQLVPSKAETFLASNKQFAGVKTALDTAKGKALKINTALQATDGKIDCMDVVACYGALKNAATALDVIIDTPMPPLPPAPQKGSKAADTYEATKKTKTAEYNNTKRHAQAILGTVNKAMATMDVAETDLAYPLSKTEKYKPAGVFASAKDMKKYMVVALEQINNDFKKAINANLAPNLEEAGASAKSLLTGNDKLNLSAVEGMDKALIDAIKTADDLKYIAPMLKPALEEIQKALKSNEKLLAEGEKNVPVQQPGDKIVPIGPGGQPAKSPQANLQSILKFYMDSLARPDSGHSRHELSDQAKEDQLRASFKTMKELVPKMVVGDVVDPVAVASFRDEFTKSYKVVKDINDRGPADQNYTPARNMMQLMDRMKKASQGIVGMEISQGPVVGNVDYAKLLPAGFSGPKLAFASTSPTGASPITSLIGSVNARG